MAKCWFSISALPQMLSGKDNHWFFCNILFKPKIHLKFILIRSHIPNSIKTSIQNPTRSEKTKKEKGSGNRVLLYTCMRRFGRIRWSIPVEANGEARCCNPADWSHRAMTASPASTLAGPALCSEAPPAWSYSAAAAAAGLLCCIWPPMWRCCARRCGANFQVLKKTTTKRTQNTKSQQFRRWKP